MTLLLALPAKAGIHGYMGPGFRRESTLFDAHSFI
jgi:hypothetical protein